MAGSREASTLSSAPTSSNVAKPAIDVVGVREASSLSTTLPSPSANPTKAPGNPEPPVVPTVPFRLEIHLPDLSQRAPLPPVDPVRIQSVHRHFLLAPCRIFPPLRVIQYLVMINLLNATFF